MKLLFIIIALLNLTITSDGFNAAVMTLKFELELVPFNII